MSLSKKPKYLNRELSWVAFNKRVLDQALNKQLPVLERLKFLAIVSSNFDEFFMVRMAMLATAKKNNIRKKCPSGLTITQQIQQVSTEAKGIIKQQYKCLKKDILPAISKLGIKILKPSELNPDQLIELRSTFKESIFPVLTPIKVNQKGRLPIFGNHVLHVIFKLKKQKARNIEHGIVPIPQNLDRFIRISSEDKQYHYVLLEEAVTYFSGDLFKDHEAVDAATFRITRNSDKAVDEDRDDDFVEAMQEIIDGRDHNGPVRLAITADKKDLTKLLANPLKIGADNIYEVDGPIDLSSFMDLAFIEGFDKHKAPTWKSVEHPYLPDSAPLWETLAERDILLHNPYHSFNPIIRMVEEAANDKNTLAIKITLYRTSGKSPIVQNLIKAAKKGIQVTVLVELKARFDEEQNIQWAKVLERAGAIVIYGVVNLKVHSKALMVVRKEELGVKRYFHLGTGNYNEKTAAIYTDMSLLSSNESIAFDLTLFFNTLTGYTSRPNFNNLHMAPYGIKSRIIGLIQRESERAQSGTGGKIYAKLNSLADTEVIEALYGASQNGVEINLNVRGICMLVPGVKGLSENIKVISVIDRFLEHTRMFHFNNGGNPEVYLSSADWMSRNLDKRIELLFPIENKRLKKEILNNFKIYFNDNTQSYTLNSKGAWCKTITSSKRKVRAQEVFHTEAVKKDLRSKAIPKTIEIKPRRKPPKD
jgi:polyphosphate kinase